MFITTKKVKNTSSVFDYSHVPVSSNLRVNWLDLKTFVCIQLIKFKNIILSEITTNTDFRVIFNGNLFYYTGDSSRIKWLDGYASRAFIIFSRDWFKKNKHICEYLWAKSVTCRVVKVISDIILREGQSSERWWIFYILFTYFFWSYRPISRPFLHWRVSEVLSITRRTITVNSWRLNFFFQSTEIDWCYRQKRVLTYFNAY